MGRFDTCSIGWHWRYTHGRGVSPAQVNQISLEFAKYARKAVIYELCFDCSYLFTDYTLVRELFLRVNLGYVIPAKWVTPKFKDRVDWLIDWIVFYAISAIFQPYNSGVLIEERFQIFIGIKVYYPIMLKNLLTVKSLYNI